MRRCRVYNHNRFAGVLEQLDDGTFRFCYDEAYLADDSTEPVSLTLPKRGEPYRCDHLFPFFYGLTAEGANRRLQARLLGIDEDDAFGLLMATGRDTIGSVTVEPDQS